MICLSCGYETEDKSNYKKHILTEKHAWYSSNGDETKKNGYHKCEYCKYITKRTDNLQRHNQNKHVGMEHTDLTELEDEDIDIDGFKGKDKVMILLKII